MPPMTAAELRDKLLGMILLGAYADALGAPFESEGLKGRAGDPSSADRLAPAREYQPPGSDGDPWWVWPDGDDIDPDAVGMPTDDSACRLLILHEWLCTGDGPDNLGEEAFIRWMEERAGQPPGRRAESWRRNRYRQLQSWIAMMQDASHWNELRRRFPDDPEAARRRWNAEDANRFYVPGVPVIFGMFLYAELGALRAGCSCEDILAEFAGFCRLDQDHARGATAITAALVAEAVTAPPDAGIPGAWFVERAGALASEPRLPGAETLRDAIDSGVRHGTESRGIDPAEFTSLLEEEVHQPRTRRNAHGLASFDPALFLEMMSAAAAYAGADTHLALRILARAPGDSDTMPSILGTIMGARIGADRLSDWSDAMAEDLAAMRATVEQTFDISFEQRARCLANLVRRFGCLALEEE